MSNKRNLKLHVATPLDAIEEKAKRYRKKQRRRATTFLVMLALIIGGTVLLLSCQMYSKTEQTNTYIIKNTSTNNYEQFGSGIIRYSRDGVVYLTDKNEEVWNQPYQIQNPIIDVNESAFAVADSGGNSIIVFSGDGMRGEIETTLPIEKISVSNQGIVSAILKNEDSPMIVSYDAKGNVLVEQQITTGNTGYPVSLDLSGDGNLLAVSFLSTQNGVLSTRIAYYNFGAVGQDKSDNVVTLEEYRDIIVPETFFMDESTSVAVGDNVFMIYKGDQIPELSKRVEIGQEIKSVVHSSKYIGLVLQNPRDIGYELRLYNKSGNMVMSKDFTGEYGNIKIVGSQVIMHEGSKGCIITKNGIQKFKGDFGVEAQEIIPLTGFSRYIVISAKEIQEIRLIK